MNALAAAVALGLALLPSCGFDAGLAAPAPLCANGQKDSAETDVDCGGTTCAACTDGLACAAAADCASGTCAGGACLAAACNDGLRNGAESDVDCGGDACDACAEGRHCASAADCASDYCSGAVCRVPTCSDAVKNGDESDADCGGPSCPACNDGQACDAGASCTSGVCLATLCAPATCRDGVKNGDESTVDCGSGCPCPDGSPCTMPEHCENLVCTGGACEPAACNDGVHNGGESDADCGGGCVPCGDGQACGSAADCASSVCEASICKVPTCGDGAKNGVETDVDCGGPCGACGAAKVCATDADCASGVCKALVCAAPTCSDAVENGAESDVDCGGACVSCASGLGCAQASDCQSGVCEGVPKTCSAPLCTDGVTNGGEPDIDCGGGCAAKCQDAKLCAGAADCQSGVCSQGQCQTPACTDGVKNGAESDVDCGGACIGCANGDACLADADCASKRCGPSPPTCAPWSMAVPLFWQSSRALAVDAAANVVATGGFGTSIDLGGGTLSSSGAPSTVFLAKYAPAGQHLWSKAFGGGQATTAAVDAAGNLVIAGVGTGGAYGGAFLPCAGATDVLIAKYDPGGNHVWSKLLGGVADDRAHGLAVDAAGDVVVTGAFWSPTLGFGGPPLDKASGSLGANVFVAKLSGASGDHIWSKAFGTTEAQGYAVALDAVGDVFVTGSFNSTIDLGGGTLAAVPGGNKVFLAKLAGASGAHLWSNAWSPGYGAGFSVAVDGGGNVLLAGYASGGTNFGGGPLTGGNGDQFVAKLAGHDGAHFWARMFAGSGGADGYMPIRVDADATGNAVVAGSFSGASTDFGTGTVTNAGAPGTDDVFVAKYAAASGAALWAETYGSAGDDFVKGVAVDRADGNVLIIGGFEQQIDFGAGVHSAPSPSLFLTSLGPAP